ncbi:MAG: helix-turn-helix transcriptional regulator [Myxococcota bacterium]
MAQPSTALKMLDAIYRLDRPDDVWLMQLIEATRSRFDAGLGATAILYRTDDRAAHLEALVMEPGLIPAEDVYQAAETASQAGQRAVFSRVPGFTTISERLRGSSDAAHVRKTLGRHEIVDLVYFNAVDEHGGLVLGCPLPEEAAPEPPLRDHWWRVALHLSAALRLRRTLGRPARPEDGAAVFTPSGRLLHASAPLADTPVLERLRALVADRVRLRREDESAVTHLWPGLIEGRFSIVDAFDRDGRHLLVAVANPPAASALRALSRREAEVVYAASQGHSNNQIGYGLGLAEGTVSAHLRDARRKLGVRRRSQLIALAKFAGRAEPLAVGDQHLAVVDTSAASPVSLTDAERDVLELVTGGLTNREIAKRRGTSERTVANQVASILRKTGAGSRYELTAAC